MDCGSTDGRMLGEKRDGQNGSLRVDVGEQADRRDGSGRPFLSHGSEAHILGTKAPARMRFETATMIFFRWIKNPRWRDPRIYIQISLMGQKRRPPTMEVADGPHVAGGEASTNIDLANRRIC